MRRSVGREGYPKLCTSEPPEVDFSQPLAIKKDKLKYKHDLELFLFQQEEWEDRNGLIYKKFFEH